MDEQKDILDSEYQKPTADKTTTTLLMIVSFLMPLIGLIIYLVKRKKDPVAAEKISKAALAGFIFFMAIRMIMLVVA